MNLYVQNQQPQFTNTLVILKHQNHRFDWRLAVLYMTSSCIYVLASRILCRYHTQTPLFTLCFSMYCRAVKYEKKPFYEILKFNGLTSHKTSCALKYKTNRCLKGSFSGTRTLKLDWSWNSPKTSCAVKYETNLCWKGSFSGTRTWKLDTLDFMKSKILPTFAKKVQKQVVQLNMKQNYAEKAVLAELVLEN